VLSSVCALYPAEIENARILLQHGDHTSGSMRQRGLCAKCSGQSSGKDSGLGDQEFLPPHPLRSGFGDRNRIPKPGGTRCRKSIGEQWPPPLRGSCKRAETRQVDPSKSSVHSGDSQSSEFRSSTSLSEIDVSTSVIRNNGERYWRRTLNSSASAL
jgi:hypothetical protein